MIDYYHLKHLAPIRARITDCNIKLWETVTKSVTKQ